MKKLILAFVTLILSVGASTTAYAGSINSNEQAVINAAGQTFSYNGKDYRLDSSYIGQLSAYMSKDDVDLTSAQRDKALASVNSYIEAGVQGGYLKPVDGGSSNQSSGSGSGNSSSNTSPDSSNQGSDNSNTSGSGNTTSGNSDSNSGTSNSSSNNTGSDNSASGNGSASGSNTSGGQYEGDVSKYNGNTGNIKNDNKPGNKDSNESQDTSPESVDEFLLDMIMGETNTKNSTSDNSIDDKSNISNKDDELAVMDMDKEEVEKSIIKNTGFNLTRTYAMASFMGVIMLAGVVITVKNQYFAQSDE